MTDVYENDDLVYVDPDTRKVVGRVEFDKNDNPKQLEKKFEPRPVKPGEKPERKRPTRKRYYPWGTYRTMKKIYRIEGKEKESEDYKTLDQAISLAVEQPFWD